MVIDPFTNPTEAADTPTDTTGETALSLFELNSMVHAVLHHTMADTYRLVAEISELRVASNGHCYLEFVEKDTASGALMAKARGNIWRNNYIALSTRFRQVTGQTLEAGIKVLAEVSISFHELYGYSLTVNGIDPTYTLGDLARRRREIIRQLEEDGVINLNKELPLPRIIRRIAIISSKTAAGYGDFCHQLEQSGYAFETSLFPATMQGNQVETSIIAALDRIAAESGRWDVVAIIRGGGATTDLSGFDSYLLAANVAQFPLPILTGIGHERDDTVIDLVAGKRLKTPTAVAAFLIERRSDEKELLHDLTQRLTQAAERLVQAETQRLGNLSQRLELKARECLHLERTICERLITRYRLAATHYTARQREEMLWLKSGLQLHTMQRLQTERQRLTTITPQLTTALRTKFQQDHAHLEQLARSIRLAGPDRILALGFTITLKGNRPVRDPRTLTAGDIITTRFAQGELQSEVK